MIIFRDMESRNKVTPEPCFKFFGSAGLKVRKGEVVVSLLVNTNTCAVYTISLLKLDFYFYN